MQVSRTLTDQEFFKTLIELETMFDVLSKLYGGPGSEGHSRLLRDIERRLQTERRDTKKKEFAFN